MSRSTELEIVKPKEYKKLNREEVYDHEAAEELADALTEMNTLLRRVQTLKDLTMENEDLHPFVWTTADAKVIAIHKLEDDHLTNILQHLFINNRDISKALRAEARKRGIEIPETNFRRGVNMLAAGGDFDDVHNEDIGNPYDLG